MAVGIDDGIGPPLKYGGPRGVIRPQGVGGGGAFSGESASSRTERVCVWGGGGGEKSIGRGNAE